MATDPYGVAIFCEMIRREDGGQVSLIGCFGGDIQFARPAPGWLSTFAAHIVIHVPIGIKPKKLRLFALKAQGNKPEVICSVDKEVSPEELVSVNENDTKKIFAFPMEWSPLKFDADGFVEVRCLIDEDYDLLLGRIRVGFPKANDG